MIPESDLPGRSGCMLNHIVALIIAVLFGAACSSENVGQDGILPNKPSSSPGESGELVNDSSAKAQSERRQHEQLRAALEHNDPASAEALLREMMNGSPDAFARNNYDYLLGRLSDMQP